MTAPVFRFAPSPNGRLHLGHALSALTGFESALRMGGRFLLRIEDIDSSRTRDELIQAIFDDLSWLGVMWEEPVLRQSTNVAVYQGQAERLARMGLLYPCFASRSEISAALPTGHRSDPDGAPIYSGLYRDYPRELSAARVARSEPHAMRLDMSKAITMARDITSGEPITVRSFDEEGIFSDNAADPARWGDAVIVRKDAPASYHLACVVDDARQGVTHVTRGADLLAATDLHRLLQLLLGLPQPNYHHHRLITEASGRKLSKSAGDISIAALRESGATVQDVRRLIGLKPEISQTVD